MTTDPELEPLLAANDQFYRALSLADLEAMRQVWLTDPAAVCSHPGSAPLYGWEAIQQSWRQIFANQGPLRIWASEARVRVFGQTAEVACLENVDAGQLAGGGVLQTRAVNIFRRVLDQWKLLEHHAAPAAGGVQPLAPFSHN